MSKKLGTESKFSIHQIFLAKGKSLKVYISIHQNWVYEDPWEVIMNVLRDSCSHNIKVPTPINKDITNPQV